LGPPSHSSLVSVRSGVILFAYSGSRGRNQALTWLSSTSATAIPTVLSSTIQAAFTGLCRPEVVCRWLRRWGRPLHGRAQNRTALEGCRRKVSTVDRVYSRQGSVKTSFASKGSSLRTDCLRTGED
jgi:hypothetical protein